MTKEELIKLSRENLRKSKQGSLCECYDEAFIKGYELSEKRIEELEKENKVLVQNLEDTEILNKTYEKRFDDFKKENAELDCQKNRNKFCYSCANATERCFRNEIGCPCGKYKSYKDENAELKKKLKEELKTIADKDLSFVARFDGLEKENAELKDDNMVMAKNYSKMEQKFYNNLTTAKEIISEYINILKGDTKNWKKTQEKAEQFLNNEIVTDLDEYKDREYDE